MVNDENPLPPRDGTIASKIVQHLDDAPLEMKEFGNYEILGEIARGGVGIIYKARQRGLDRVVALKLLQGGSSASQESVQRFLHEAQAAAKLQHPNIVPIHDFGTEDGMYYFTMDFVEGESLADRMARGPIPARETLEIVRQVADALHYAHEHGVVHRDIKPGNILIDREGHVKVTDFGIAKEVNQEEQSRLTVTGQVMGTPRYMSPEQAGGHTARADQRSDVFSLGVTLYEMLTGQPAFDADNVFTVLHKVTSEDPPPPHRLNYKVHRDASTICEKAMEKLPERRYGTAGEMASDIGRFLAGEPIEARPVGGAERIARKLRKHWRPILLNTAIAVAVIGAAAYGTHVYLASRPSHLRLQLALTGVAVTLDGNLVLERDLGDAIILKPGSHLLYAEREPDFAPQTIKFETKPGERLTLPVSLVRRMGRIAITTTPPDAAVTIVTPRGTRLPFRGPRVEQELPTGTYVALVHRENYLAQRIETTIEPGQTRALHFALPPINVWAVPTSGNVLSVPAVARMNDATSGDVVAGDDSGAIYCLNGRDGVARWVFRAQDAVQAPIALADINNDGVPDVIVGSVDRRLYCLNGKDGKLLWSFETGGAILGPPRLKDLNGDNITDVFIGSADGFVYALSGADGRLFWKFRTQGRVESALAWQRTVTGYLLLVGSGDKTLYALNPADGSVAWKVETGSPLLFPMRIEDPNSNGRLVAFLPTPRVPGDALTHTAVSLDERRVVGVSDAFPLRLDIKGDGKPLKLLVSPRGTECYPASGTNLLWRSDYAAVAPHGADINGDGALDLVFNNGPDEIVALSGANGEVIGRIRLDDDIGRGFSMEDVDRDSVPDITVGVGRKVCCFSWVGGRKKWFAKSAAYYDAPLVQLDGKLIAKNQGGQIAAYNTDNPQPLWTLATSPQQPPYNGIAAEQGIIADADAHARIVRVIRAADGSVLWQANVPGVADSPIGWPALGNGLLVVGDGLEGVHCFNATNAAARWIAPLRRVTLAPGIGSDSAWVADGVGVLHGLALADGQERWKFNPASGGARWASPPTRVQLKGAEALVAVNNNGFTYTLNARDGNTLWWFQHTKTPAYSRNRVVLAGPTRGVLATAAGDVYCLDLAQGKPLWTATLREPVLGEVALTGTNRHGVADILVGTMSRRLHCLDGRNGVLLWSYDVGGQVRYSVPQVLANAFVFIGTGPPENGLYCLRRDAVADNPLPWFGPWRSLSLTK